MSHTLDKPNARWSIRPARSDDFATLAELAVLDSQKPLDGAALLAEVDGEAWAAVEIATGRTVADPFRPSAAVALATRRRAEQLREADGSQGSYAGRPLRLATP